MVKIMKRNEIKRTVEEVVRVEYIAEDGQVFRNEEEYKKYEESALFAVSKELKRLNKKPMSQYNINDDCSDEYEVEVFDVQTEKDKENLMRYAYLKTKQNYSNADVNGVFNNLTIGHEVILFWNYDQDYCWIIGDGSINGYCEWIRNNILKCITPETVTE